MPCDRLLAASADTGLHRSDGGFCCCWADTGDGLTSGKSKDLCTQAGSSCRCECSKPYKKYVFTLDAFQINTPALGVAFQFHRGYCIPRCMQQQKLQEGCRATLFSLPPTHNVRLGFENLLEVTDWVHTLRRETSCSHYPVIAVMRNSFSNCSLGSSLSHACAHARVCVPFLAIVTCICVKILLHSPITACEG